MDATLLEIIEKFAAQRHSETAPEHSSFRRQGLETPDGAYCMCDSTSYAFIQFARGEGYVGSLMQYCFHIFSNSEKGNPDPTLYCIGMHDTATYRKAPWHMIVETPDFFIDFTARQYHSKACYPHIISKNIKSFAATEGA
jgi:hypothetical protein